MSAIREHGLHCNNERKKHNCSSPLFIPLSTKKIFCLIVINADSLVVLFIIKYIIYYQGPPIQPNSRPALQSISVNMANMTDAFMTAAVVAAVAEGTSYITGIENQRVKECNRIEAMVVELAKCGINAWELPDGIAIEGQGNLAEPYKKLFFCLLFLFS